MEGQGAPAVDYPVRDGRPMGETDRHRDELQDFAVNVLIDHFAARAHEVYGSGNNFVYYAEGDPRAVVSPDTSRTGAPGAPRSSDGKIRFCNAARSVPNKPAIAQAA